MMIVLSRFYKFITAAALMCLALASFAQTEEAPVQAPTDFAGLVQYLATGSLSERAETVKKLAALKDPRSTTIIAALEQGNLYFDSTLNKVAIKNDTGNYFDAISQSAVSNDISNFKKIPVNNSLRNQLRSLLAQLNLGSEDETVRLTAVKRLLADGLDAESAAILAEKVQTEKNKSIQSSMNIALALFQLKDSDEKVRMSAVDKLRGSLEPEARSALTEASTADESQAVRNTAISALKSIENSISYYRLAETVFFGLSLGSVLLLSAIGLAITFGVMGVINMAHGELMMIGAYTTWVIQQVFPNHIAYSLLIAVPTAFLVAGAVGVAIERGVIRFLYGRPLETLLATFGLSLILQQAARSIFTPLNRAVSLPEWMSGSMVINPVLSITYNRLYILIFGVLVFILLQLILKKTSLGLKVRAVSQNRTMARAVGVRASWVDALTFGLGSGIAGVAGVALSQLTNVGPNLGQAYIIDSFMVVVFGGVGNLWGTLVSAMGLGIINKFLEPYAGAVLAKVLVLVLLILFIQKKPKGMFPQKGRAAAD
ncbi:urea ABC transporter permease subunit UrtB [Cellvibrio sp.]|uniref:urea ABC transporter permease subunit UrtB n=1 Tax=Cellvibrio sp. TaxID=1965322 RepID=UPI00396480DD